MRNLSPYPWANHDALVYDPVSQTVLKLKGFPYTMYSSWVQDFVFPRTDGEKETDDGRGPVALARVQPMEQPDPEARLKELAALAKKALTDQDPGNLRRNQTVHYWLSRDITERLSLWGYL